MGIKIKEEKCFLSNLSAIKKRTVKLLSIVLKGEVRFNVKNSPLDRILL